MNANAFIKILIISVGLVVAVVLLQGALDARTSSISYLVMWGGVALACYSFIKPRAGLFIVTGEAFLTDYIKKVAVFYGNVSLQTIIEVMGVVMLALVATLAGRLTQLAFRSGKKLSLIEVLFYAVAFVVAFVIMLKGNGGFANRGQQAFNVGLYIAVGGLIVGLFRNFEELWSYYKFALLLGLLWCAMAIKQVHFGYSWLEEYYAFTGLSRVATLQFLQTIYEFPRPSGLGSGSPNLGVITVFVPISLWATFNRSKWYAVPLLIVLYAIAISQIKSMVATTVLMLLLYPLLRFRHFLKLGYVIGVVTLGTLIVMADTILYNIAEIDRRFRDVFGLSNEYSIQTFSDRLQGWQHLTDLGSFPLLPGEPVSTHETHDQVTAILNAVGILPSILVFGGIIYALYRFHKSARSALPGPEQRLSVYMACYVALSTVTGMMIGGFLQGQPQGLVVWFSAGGVILLGQLANEQRNEERRRANAGKVKKAPTERSQTAELPLGSLARQG